MLQTAWSNLLCLRSDRQAELRGASARRAGSLGASAGQPPSHSTLAAHAACSLQGHRGAHRKGGMARGNRGLDCRADELDVAGAGAAPALCMAPMGCPMGVSDGDPSRSLAAVQQ